AQRGRIRVRRGRGASPGRRGPHAGAARPNAPGGTEPVAGRHGAGTHAAGARQAQGPKGRRGSGARDQPLHPLASALRLPPALKARAHAEPEKATPEGTRIDPPSVGDPVRYRTWPCLVLPARRPTTGAPGHAATWPRSMTRCPTGLRRRTPRGASAVSAPGPALSALPATHSDLMGPS